MENETFALLFIGSIFPLLLLWFYLFIIERMKKDKNIERLPVYSLLFVLMAYGSLSMALLSTLFGKWTDILILVFFVIAIISVVILFFVAVKNYKKRYDSVYHSRIYRLSLSYYLLLPFVYLIVIFSYLQFPTS